MCNYKDTTLGIKKLDFGIKRGVMAVYLTDGREVLVPLSMFPDIKRLSTTQRNDWMIMDDQYFTFENTSKIYSVKDVLHYRFALFTITLARTRAFIVLVLVSATLPYFTFLPNISYISSTFLTRVLPLVIYFIVPRCFS